MVEEFLVNFQPDASEFLIIEEPYLYYRGKRVSRGCKIGHLNFYHSVNEWVMYILYDPLHVSPEYTISTKTYLEIVNGKQYKIIPSNEEVEALVYPQTGEAT